MSAGDIDDRLGPEGELDELRAEHPELDRYLTMAWQLKPVRTFFIPFGAGISSTGLRVYVSNDIQAIINGIECESALVRHETTEWALREYCKIGEDYASDPRGHRLANRAEHDLVIHLIGIDGWERYSEIIDPQVMIDEREDIEDKPIPGDLALYPYDDEMVTMLCDAMYNKRSEEEWSKLT